MEVKAHMRFLVIGLVDVVLIIVLPRLDALATDHDRLPAFLSGARVIVLRGV